MINSHLLYQLSYRGATVGDTNDNVDYCQLPDNKKTVCINTAIEIRSQKKSRKKVNGGSVLSANQHICREKAKAGTVDFFSVNFFEFQSFKLKVEAQRWKRLSEQEKQAAGPMLNLNNIAEYGSDLDIDTILSSGSAGLSEN